MDNEEATKTCSQCHKDVAVTNFALHETHCSRFLCVCPDCDESVPKDQLSQHREDEHSQVKCSKCNKKMERRFLTDHESDECVERLQSCEFCDLDMPWKDLDKHCLVCGSRTERCRDCGCYVKLSDKHQHGSACSANGGDLGPSQSPRVAPTNTKPTVQCKTCMAAFSSDDIDAHKCGAGSLRGSKEAQEEEEENEEENDDHYFEQASNFVAMSLLSRAYAHRVDTEDPHRISTCPHCHLALPIITLRWHTGKCRRHNYLEKKMDS